MLQSSLDPLGKNANLCYLETEDKNIVDDVNSTHPLRQRLLKLVIEQTFVNSSLSSQCLKNRKKKNHSIRRRKIHVYCECLEKDLSLFSNIPSAKNNSESCYITL